LNNLIRMNIEPRSQLRQGIFALDRSQCHSPQSVVEETAEVVWRSLKWHRMFEKFAWRQIIDMIQVQSAPAKPVFLDRKYPMISCFREPVTFWGQLEFTKNKNEVERNCKRSVLEPPWPSLHRPSAPGTSVMSYNGRNKVL
jgi:hypothetical protein